MAKKVIDTTFVTTELHNLIDSHTSLNIMDAFSLGEVFVLQQMYDFIKTDKFIDMKRLMTMLDKQKKFGTVAFKKYYDKMLPTDNNNKK